MWEVELAEPCKLPLVSFCVHLESVSSPSQRCCHALSSWIKHNAFHRGDFSHLHPFPSAGPGCPVPSVVKGSIQGLPPYLIQWVRLQRMGPLWANPGFGILIHLSPPGSSLSSANLLYKEDFIGMSGVGVALFQTWRSALGWPLEGVRDWILTRT